MSDLSMGRIKKRSEFINIALFSTGKAVSMFASAIYSFAIGLYVLNLTGSALNYATTIMLSVLPMIVISPFAGVLADKVSKRAIIVGMDLANGVLFFILYQISIAGGLGLATIYISTILLSVFTSFFSITFEATKPNLVSPNSRLKLNSISKLIDSSTAILGPVFGGIMYALVDIKLFILINSISFILSAISELFIDYNFHADETTSDNPPFMKHIRSGFKYMKESKVLREAFMLFVVLNFLLGFSVNVPLPYIINESLGLPSVVFGLVNSMIPVGLIIGTLSLGKIIKNTSYRSLLILTSCILAILSSFVGLPLLLKASQSIYVYGIYYSVLCILIGIGIAYVDIPVITIMQDEIPSNLRGVVFGLTLSLVKIVLPLSLILSGYLVGHIPVSILPMVGGFIALLYPLHLRLTTKKGLS